MAWPIIFIVMPIIMGILFIYFGDLPLKESMILLWFFPIFIIVWIVWIVKILNYRKAKKYKKIWWWIIKKVKVTWIKIYTSQSKNSSFTWYYIEAKEWDKTYYSDIYEKWRIWWIMKEDLEAIYNDYWYKYDENETYKQYVLKEYDRRMAQKECEIKTEWLFKKLSAKFWIYCMKNQREIIEKWYETPYREVNLQRIKVWDTVDVYIDPDDEKNYWMDIDFLFKQ